MSRNVIWRNISVFFLLVLFLIVTGCRRPAIIHKEFEPVFFPSPPNKPKLQFLTSFSGKDLQSSKKANFLETYIFGESSDDTIGMISQPYGLAIHNGKIYVCDVGEWNIKVIDLDSNTISVFPGGKSLKKPISIFIESNGTKYIADSTVGAIIMFDRNDKLVGFLGSQLGIKPNDVVVRGDRIYLTDTNSNQVFVLDKRSGELMQTVGRNLTDKTQWDPDQFALITCLAMDSRDNIYVTDKLKGLVTKFDSSGTFLRTYSRHGSLPDCLVRAKGIALDKEDRLWVVDAGPAMAAKVYRNEDGQFLMIFGLSGTDPGQMYMPASISIDYENVDYFKKYAVDGAELECLVLVTNQYGPHKVNVYGFGNFPEKYALQGAGEEQTTDRESIQESQPILQDSQKP